MQTWQTVIITLLAVVLAALISAYIFQLGKNSATLGSIEQPPHTSTAASVDNAMSERAAYILSYYDARIDNLSKNLEYKPSYFTVWNPDDGDDSNLTLEEYRFQSRGERQNKYGASKGAEVGTRVTALIDDFDTQIELFRAFYKNYENVSLDEARQYFVNMEMWSADFEEEASYITSTLGDYSYVLDRSWHSRIDTAMEELLKVQAEMLAISKEFYQSKQ